MTNNLGIITESNGKLTGDHHNHFLKRTALGVKPNTFKESNLVHLLFTKCKPAYSLAFSRKFATLSTVKEYMIYHRFTSFQMFRSQLLGCYLKSFRYLIPEYGIPTGI